MNIRTTTWVLWIDLKGGMGLVPAFRYFWFRLTREVLPMKLAWMLPRKVAMWAAIRVIAHGTAGRWESQVVPELTAMEALDRWDEPA